MKRPGDDVEQVQELVQAWTDEYGIVDPADHVECGKPVADDAFPMTSKTAAGNELFRRLIAAGMMEPMQ